MQIKNELYDHHLMPGLDFVAPKRFKSSNYT